MVTLIYFQITVPPCYISIPLSVANFTAGLISFIKTQADNFQPNFFPWS
jgi:hypothetical protein